MLWRGQMIGFPAQCPLLLEDGERTEGVTAMQRNGMIQDMENAHSELPIWQDTSPRRVPMYLKVLQNFNHSVNRVTERIAAAD